MVGRTLKHYIDNAAALVTRYEDADVKQLQHELAEAFPSGTELLELGCGSGRDAAFLLGKGFDVTVIDGCQAMLDHAVRLHPELQERMHLLKLPGPIPFPDADFDGVYAIAVLMHLDAEGTRAVLREVTRVLKENGRLFFSVSLHRDDVGENGRDTKGRRFTSLAQDEWVEMCESLGLRALSIREEEDGLGRADVRWGSFLFEKPMAGGAPPP